MIMEKQIAMEQVCSLRTRKEMCGLQSRAKKKSKNLKMPIKSKFVNDKKNPDKSDKTEILNV